jgi:hypothetical protein
MFVHLTEHAAVFHRRYSVCGVYDFDSDKRLDTVFDVLKAPAEQVALELEQKVASKFGGKNTIVLNNLRGCYDFTKLVSEALSFGFAIKMIRFLPRTGKNRTNAYVVFGSNAECAAFMDMVAESADILTVGAFKAKNIAYSDRNGVRDIKKKFGGLKCAEENTWTA